MFFVNFILDLLIGGNRVSREAHFNKLITNLAISFVNGKKGLFVFKQKDKKYFAISMLNMGYRDSHYTLISLKMALKLQRSRKCKNKPFISSLLKKIKKETRLKQKFNKRLTSK